MSTLGRALTASALALAGLAPAAPASAQPSISRRFAPPPPPQLGNVQAPRAASDSLKGHLAVDVALRLLASSEAEDRRRAFELLGALGSAQALDLLVKVFDNGGAARSERDRLIAIRALAPHTKLPAVRELFVRVMDGVGSSPEHGDPLDPLIEQAAALALAASGTSEAFAALGKKLRQPSHVAEVAHDALLAHPPPDLTPILAAHGTPTSTLARLLAELDDPRALAPLTELVRSAPAQVRGEAAYQLARLGVRETHELALRWQRDAANPPLHEAAERILALEAQQSAPRADELARLLPLPAEPDAAARAAMQLALSPNEQADALLERALRALPPARARRQLLRIAVVRRWALGRALPNLEAALAQLERSREPSDRAVWAWATALGDPEHAARLVARATPLELRAIARAARLPQVASALAERLQSAQKLDPLTRDALAACLGFEPASERVATDVLLTLLDEGGIAAPLAARALAQRDSPSLRPRIALLAASDDPLLRAHALLGLGRSEDPSALGLLANAYRFESEPAVRLAIVRALSLRPEAARRRTLTLAATLDASGDVRRAARLALHGHRLGAFVAGAASAWLDFGAASEGTPSAIVAGPDGLALPAVADPDGVAIVSALEIGPFTLRVAPPAPSDKAPGASP